MSMGQDRYNMYRSEVNRLGTTSTEIFGTNRPMIERLAELMRSSGIPSMAEAARRYGIGYEMFKAIMAGKRNLTVENARKVARYHRVAVGWILTGEGAPKSALMVPLQGRIGAGQEMMLFEDNTETVEGFFDTDTTTAFEVQGDSMLPVARAGDIAFFGPSTRDLRHLLHRECAVVLEDGRRFFKILQNGSRPGLYSLASYNGATIQDVEVHSAGPFLGVMRR